MSAKTRTEVRLDPAVHNGLKSLAERSGLSLNQLVEGVLAWAVKTGNPGRPPIVAYRDGIEHISTDPTEHVVWFGQNGCHDGGDMFHDVVFMLDYTGSRAVVHAHEMERDDEP